jgi:hypothetical protein
LNHQQRNGADKMNEVLTAKYTADYKGITITFYDDDTAQMISYGDVSDEDLDAAVAAKGGEISGYSCTIEI